MKAMQIRCVVLAGGVGAAKFVEGLARVADPSRLTIISNTGDDVELHGLWISPDVDTMLYTLAGIADPDKGWGIRGDTFETLDALGRLGEETWFWLGDRDLATHLFRTRLRAEGRMATAITRRIAKRLGVCATVLPMTDGSVRTMVRTTQGDLPFQEYFVKHACLPDVVDVRFEGAESSVPSPDVLRAIESADVIVIAPSNPIASIGPILALPGICHALKSARAPKIAVSPLVGGRSIKGPSDRMMSAKGFSPDAIGVANYYRGLIDGLVIDRLDVAREPSIRTLGLDVLVTDTLLTSADRKTALAKETIEWANTFHDQHRHSRQKPVLC